MPMRQLEGRRKVYVYVSESDYDAIEKAARIDDRSVSSWCRVRLQDAAHRFVRDSKQHPRKLEPDTLE